MVNRGFIRLTIITRLTLWSETKLIAASIYTHLCRKLLADEAKDEYVESNGRESNEVRAQSRCVVVLPLL